jgi:hypothetical protein
MLRRSLCDNVVLLKGVPLLSKDVILRQPTVAIEIAYLATMS